MQVIVKESASKGYHQVSISQPIEIIIGFDDILSDDYDDAGIVSLLRNGLQVATLWNTTATEVYNYWQGLNND